MSFPDLSNDEHVAALKKAAALTPAEREKHTRSTALPAETLIALETFSSPGKLAALLSALCRRADVPSRHVDAVVFWEEFGCDNSLSVVERGRVALFVPELVIALLELAPGAESRQAARDLLRRDDDPIGPERSYTTDAAGMNELVVLPIKSGFRVLVRSEEPTNVEHVEREEHEEHEDDIGEIRQAIEIVRDHLRADEKAEIKITPNEDGWTLAEIPREQREPGVFFQVYADDIDTEGRQVERLYKAMGGETSEDGERPIDAELEDVVLVHARPFDEHRVLRDVLPSDMLAALREIEREIDSAPGDPGRNVCLVDRVRGVLESARRRDGR